VTRGRVFSPADFREGVAGMLPAAFALIPFGLVCGVAAAGVGASPLEMLGLSAIVFSGAAQILATQLYAADAPVAAIVLACFVIGLRLAMYSAAMAPQVASLPVRWQRLLAFLLTDQAFAAAIRRFETGDDKRPAASHFLGGGVVLWGGWQLTNTAGYFAGNAIPAAWSLDFAVPLCFIALLAPLLRERAAIAAALASAVVVVLLAALPMRLNIIVAGLVGIAVGALVATAHARRKGLR
jgi:predicted branched-subunit amino acid permease